MDVDLKDNSEEVLDRLKKAVDRTLDSAGIEFEGFAKEILNQKVYTKSKKQTEEMGYALTGRLINSITHAVKKDEGKTYEYKDYEGNSYSETIGNGIQGDEVYIGTNVEYATGIEIGTHRKAGAVHFLKDAIQTHQNRLKELIEMFLKNA